MSREISFVSSITIVDVALFYLMLKIDLLNRGQLVETKSSMRVYTRCVVGKSEIIDKWNGRKS